MSEKLIGACIFGQSGGPTAVINASAYGVISAALEAGEITKVYGASHGIKGVLDDKLYVMDEEDPEELRLLLHTPSSELGSCRYKIADPETDDTDYKRILEIFKNTMCAISSITAATIPWTPATRSAAIWSLSGTSAA